MISLFTTLKPPDGGVIDIIQRNAIMSWLQHPVEVLVFGDEWNERLEEVDLAAFYHGFPGHLRRVDHRGLNEHGTPYIAPMFEFASSIVDRRHPLMYINGDIILLPSFWSAVERINKLVGEYLVVGKRTNFPLQEKIKFEDGNWARDLGQALEERGYAAVAAAVDYFIHTPDLWSGNAAIPPDLTLARFYWDNHLTWLVGTMRRLPVIDATEWITAIHQDHPPITSFSAPEAKDNERIVAYRMAGVEHCTHRLLADGRLV